MKTTGIMKNKPHIDNYARELQELNYQLDRLSATRIQSPEDLNKFIELGRLRVAFIYYAILMINNAIEEDIKNKMILDKEFLHENFDTNIDSSDIYKYITEVIADDECRKNNYTDSFNYLGQYLIFKEYLKYLLKITTKRFLAITDIDIIKKPKKHPIKVDDLRNAITEYSLNLDDIKKIQLDADKIFEGTYKNNDENNPIHIDEQVEIKITTDIRLFLQKTRVYDNEHKKNQKEANIWKNNHTIWVTGEAGRLFIKGELKDIKKQLNQNPLMKKLQKEIANQKANITR